MSRFSSKIDALLKQRGWTHTDLSKASKINRGVVWKLVTGNQQWISPDNFRALVISITSNPATLRELVSARLADEEENLTSGLPALPQLDGTVSESIKSYTPSPILHAALALAKAAEYDADLYDAIISIARSVLPDRKDEFVKRPRTKAVNYPLRAEEAAVFPDQFHAKSGAESDTNAGKATPDAPAPGAKVVPIDYKKRHPKRKS